MLHKKNETSQQIHRTKKTSSSYSILPTLNEVMRQLKNDTPVFAQLFKQPIKEEINNFLLSPKSATNLHNQISFQNKSSLVNRMFGNTKELKIQQKHEQKKQQINSPKKQNNLHKSSSKIIGKETYINQKRRHERIQSAQQIKQITFLRADHRSLQQINRKLKKELENIKSKLINCQQQLREQSKIIEEKEEIIRKMSSFNDQLCLKLIEFQCQPQNKKAKQNSKTFEQLGVQIMALKKDQDHSSTRAFMQSARFDSQFSSYQDNLNKKQSQLRNKIKPRYLQKLQHKKPVLAEKFVEKIKRANKLINPEEQNKPERKKNPEEQNKPERKKNPEEQNKPEGKKNSFNEMTATFKTNMEKLWENYLDENEQQDQF